MEPYIYRPLDKGMILFPQVLTPTFERLLLRLMVDPTHPAEQMLGRTYREIFPKDDYGHFA